MSLGEQEKRCRNAYNIAKAIDMGHAQETASA